MNVETDLAQGRVPRDEWARKISDVLQEVKPTGLTFEMAWDIALDEAGKPPKLWRWRVNPEVRADTFFRRHAEAAYNNASAPPKHCQVNGCMEWQPCSRHGKTGADWPDIGEDNDLMAAKAKRIEIPPDAVHCLLCGRSHSPGDPYHGKSELEAA